MKIAVIGAGAMGCLFATKISRTGNKVLLLDHGRRTISAIMKNGVRVIENGKTRRFRLPIQRPPQDLRDFDLVLVLVKAYGTLIAAQELRGRIGEGTVVLTLQNGLGNFEVLTRLLGNRVLEGSTTEASLRVGPGLIEYTGKGLTVVGEPDGKKSERILKVVSLLRNAGFRSSTTRSVRSVVWSKAALNSAINPVSALTRLRNGELAKEKGLKELMFSVLNESVRVAGAEGVTLQLGLLTRRLTFVLRLTAQNESSMLQDVLNSRKTEIRELNGIIARLGRKHRIPTPLNESLFSLVVGLESNS